MKWIHIYKKQIYFTNKIHHAKQKIGGIEPPIFYGDHFRIAVTSFLKISVIYLFLRRMFMPTRGNLIRRMSTILLRLLSSIVFPFGLTIEQEVAWVNACQSTSPFRNFLATIKDRVYMEISRLVSWAWLQVDATWLHKYPLEKFFSLCFYIYYKTHLALLNHPKVWFLKNLIFSPELFIVH